MPDRCPHRYTRATDVALAALPDDIVGVAASWFDTRLLAAWSERELLVSRDEGQTFERVLENPGKIQHAAFTCRGYLQVVRTWGRRIELFGYSPGSEPWVSWAYIGDIASTGTPDDANAVVRLVPYGDEIAVLAQSATAKHELVIYRRGDEGGAWFAARVPDHAKYTKLRSWDGVSFLAITPAGTDRYRLALAPWQGSDVARVDLTLDLRTLTGEGATYARDEELPAAIRIDEIEGVRGLVRDAARRYLGICEDARCPGDTRVVRRTHAELRRTLDRRARGT